MPAVDLHRASFPTCKGVTRWSAMPCFYFCDCGAVPQKKKVKKKCGSILHKKCQVISELGFSFCSHSLCVRRGLPACWEDDGWRGNMWEYLNTSWHSVGMYTDRSALSQPKCHRPCSILRIKRSLHFVISAKQGSLPLS